MKRASTYIFSLILSVLMVFAIIGTLLLAVVRYSFSEESAVRNIRKNNIPDIVYSQLEKYYKEKYYSSGIPAEVYTGALKSEVIENNIISQIHSCFAESDFSYKDSDFSGVEENLEKFFSSYADENNISKDGNYYEKLENAQDNAKKVISDYCDVYKISTLKNQGITTKLYKALDMVQKAFKTVLAALGIIAVLIILFNIRETATFFYWLGISLIVAGITGGMPCIYLLAVNYFGSFTIKQPHIFVTYTSALNSVTKFSLILFVCAAAAGIFLITVYAVIVAKTKDRSLNQNTKIIK